tara:strand:- start:961 stop:1191 length:231 start_codon:yes stop_codon:yes gene_type:complete
MTSTVVSGRVSGECALPNILAIVMSEVRKHGPEVVAKRREAQALFARDDDEAKGLRREARVITRHFNSAFGAPATT